MFKRRCKQRGIEVVYAPVHYPQAKGKVERDIRNFKEEFLVLGRVLMIIYRFWKNIMNGTIAVVIGWA
ncbi:MAG: hypothetical protein QMC77_01195 [Methanocellales archaeon]|nr:hypothetical protein [Methanocellales archaeon]